MNRIRPGRNSHAPGDTGTIVIRMADVYRQRSSVPPRRFPRRPRPGRVPESGLTVSFPGDSAREYRTSRRRRWTPYVSGSSIAHRVQRRDSKSPCYCSISRHRPECSTFGRISARLPPVRRPQRTTGHSIASDGPSGRLARGASPIQSVARAQLPPNTVAALLLIAHRSRDLSPSAP